MKLEWSNTSIANMACHTQILFEKLLLNISKNLIQSKLGFNLFTKYINYCIWKSSKPNRRVVIFLGEPTTFLQRFLGTKKTEL